MTDDKTIALRVTVIGGAVTFW
jgi:hypothetical protein